ncbi:disease resistance-like protein CSA1 [Neltuma alba]|uniref:disease resistance-like protein CSA1 n=1 Tax=Neltuma alba TaxID=207710 RepID=UPI0010A3FEA8|nr:disease resistance-like protein CSA1 [Prosopis alba]
MNKDESLQLFSNKAFNEDHPPDEDYLKLSESVVEYTGGLPLALEVLGSFLCGRSKAEWMDALDRLKQIPDNDILQGSEAIQAIVMEDDRYGELEVEVHPEAFSKMSNIRLFFFSIFGTETEMLDCLSLRSWFILPSGLKSLSGALKVVRWPLFPLEALPLETPLHKIVAIEMHKSKIKQLWNDKQFMKNLKFMDLRNSPNFTETPDFSRVPNLEHLRLSECKSLVKVHPSLGQLKELVEVYLDGCKNLEILPEKFETDSLIKLDLSRCGKVAVLPEFGEGMKKLSYLDVSNTAIRRLPISLGSLTGLGYLDLRCCKILNLDEFLKTHITRQIAGLNVTSLTELYLEWCGINDGSIPDDFHSLSSLIVLDLSGNDFVYLPTGCFSGLSRLVFLSLDFCTMLKSLPRLPPRLIRLNASNCDSMEPLSSDGQLWNLVASLDHECRGRTKYVIPYDEEEEPGIYMFNLFECVAPRDFYAIIPGCKMPSWFQNKEDYPLSEKKGEYEYVIKVDIPPRCFDSKWCGIVVCFFISGCGDMVIDWSSKAAEDDDDYIHNLGRHSIFVFNYPMANQCIMVLELNEETCWQHLRAHDSNSLHIKLSTYVGEMEIKGSGWRVICKEDIQEWCNLRDSDQLTRPQLAAPDDELKLSWRMLRKFIMKL